jgi:hypothetical protein
MKQDLVRDDAVEGRIGERQLAGVANLESDMGLACGRAPLRTGNKRCAQVDPDGWARSDERGDDPQVITGPTADVQRTQPGPQLQRREHGTWITPRLGQPPARGRIQQRRIKEGSLV